MGYAVGNVAAGVGGLVGVPEPDTGALVRSRFYDKVRGNHTGIMPLYCGG